VELSDGGQVADEVIDEVEVTEQLGYEPYPEARGRSGGPEAASA
jgi:hypothetical protein